MLSILFLRSLIITNGQILALVLNRLIGQAQGHYDDTFFLVGHLAILRATAFYV